jgi:hypothetical protein
MARAEVKNAIRKLGDDPAKFQSLLDLPKKERRAELDKLGFPRLNRKDVEADVKELLGDGTQGGGSSARVVDWVSAIAAGVAGVLAA